jgi:hypothetical protein
MGKKTGDPLNRIESKESVSPWIAAAPAVEVAATRSGHGARCHPRHHTRHLRPAPRRKTLERPAAHDQTTAIRDATVQTRNAHLFSLDERFQAGMTPAARLHECQQNRPPQVMALRHS